MQFWETFILYHETRKQELPLWLMCKVLLDDIPQEELSVQF